MAERLVLKVGPATIARAIAGKGANPGVRGRFGSQM